jgi:hypothetical protein
MNLIEAKVQQWSDDTLKKMVADYEQFERDGAIGQCALRDAAESCCEGFDWTAPVLWMERIAFECYRELYRRTLL